MSANLTIRPDDKVGRRNLLFIFVAVGLAMATLQDWMHSSLQRYPFYISESVLFNTYWLFFLPIGLLFLHFFQTPFIKGFFGRGYFRFLGFIAIATIIHALLFSGSVYLLSLFFFSHSYDIWGNLLYSASEHLIQNLIIYSAIAGLLLFRDCKPEITADIPEASSSQQRPSVRRILVGSGRKAVTVDIDHIIMIHAASPYLEIHVKDQKYLVSGTLKSVSLDLDNQLFVRVHKSTIVNISMVLQRRSRLNGDYDLDLEGHRIVRLSRNYVPAFNQRFGQLTTGKGINSSG